MRFSRTFAICLFGLFPLRTLAADPGDPALGLAYAKEVCADCHAVSAGQKVSPNIKAPPFESIARSKLITKREITVWLMTSHPDMPDLLVPHDKRDDVIAYLMSLGE